jgi:hypothetical protein
MQKISLIIIVTLIFVLIPFFVTPSMAIPIAEYLSILLLIIASFFLFYSAKKDKLKFRQIGYSIICASLWCSSLSWFGMPFIDVVFMITGVLAFIANIYFLVHLFLRPNEGLKNVRD